jgi:hypothetical protein
MRAECTRLITAAARWPARRLPANNQFDLPMATGLMWFSTLAADNYLERRVASPVNVTGRVVVALWVFFESLMVEGRLWACGRRRRRWATQPPSGALSTVPAGAP